MVIEQFVLAEEGFVTIQWENLSITKQPYPWFFWTNTKYWIENNDRIAEMFDEISTMRRLGILQDYVKLDQFPHALNSWWLWKLWNC